jgi:uncharacterized protein YbjT (DUF2867 family)
LSSRTADAPVAVAGANGFIGRRLVARLRRDGTPVRALVRDRERGRGALGGDVDLAVADAESGEGLEDALEGCEHAFFLVHLMAGANEGYAERESASAATFAQAATAGGVERVSYLGGLGGNSPHLTSRRRTAEALIEHGPPLTYFRAAMIVGPGSESYELLRSIVELLPLAPAPSWLDNRTQPIGVRDVISYLAAAPETAGAAGREIQIGGPQALSHRQVIDELASQMGRHGPRWLPFPNRIAKPEVMAAGAATLTRGDAGVAAELALGLQEDTIVTDDSAREVFPWITPEPLSIVFQRCLDEAERDTLSRR